ncbi:hypothetical protein [Mucilaginibacter sp. OK283]|uniref:hypothetical protein n=1 Tax=Mucilaginibacter sp. OK283 TaxID=1881049 RepID=UPI000B88F6FC|nr:hypothetical protein [Mucilaginibacter sp. OK283]
MGSNNFKVQEMKELADEKANELEGGLNQCAASIGFSASFGGLFGGVGAVIGAAVAATGPACLGIW